MNQVFWGYQTHFSMGESIIVPEEGVKQIKEMGYTHLALADTMSISALVTVAKACKKADLQMIVGCTLRVKSPNGYWYPKVYVHNEPALVRLYALISNADYDRDWAYVTFEQFRDYVANDITVTSGAAQGFFSGVLTDAERLDYTNQLVTRYSAFGFVGELCAVATPPFAMQNTKVWDMADTFITNSCATYRTIQDHDARDIMQAILSRRTIDKSTMRWGPKGRFIKPQTDVDDELRMSLVMGDTLIGRPTATTGLFFGRGPGPGVVNLANFTYKWYKQDESLPKLAAHSTEIDQLRTMCAAAFDDRIKRPVFGYQPDASLLPAYQARLDYELDVIAKMGFAGYFLLVADLVQWSKDSGIIVGPGRGSVGGSLIAFIIGITEVDPIRFDLFFERFINPGRKDLPDADLDFMSERRHEIVDYLKATYGDDKVGGISNYNTLSGASAIRDVAKAMLIPEVDYNCSKRVPKLHGQSVELPDAADQVPEIQAYAAKHPTAWDVSVRLEGVLRNMGQHAAGIVVSKDPLVHRATVQQRAKDICINWDKRVSEEQGLVKIDVLGLSTLDVIKKAFDKIQTDYGKSIDILDIPMDDKKVLTAFGNGETIGIFQFESGGMRRLLKDLRKGGELTFEELAAATALYRPGPMDSGMMQDFVNIRQGVATPYYDHPSMENALKVTGGVIVYQEQVMQVARDLGGFTLQEADDLRKAMGKKDKVMMAEQRDAWVRGCVKTSGISAELAGALFDKIEAFAGYGFNRSHSVEYSIISFVCMWLKVYYPVQFFAASLEVFKEEKLLGIIEDAAKRGIKILPPDINESDGTFKRYKGTQNLIPPFNRLKGLSDITQTAILAARASGPFKSKADFLTRVEKRKCNARHQDVLDRVGAFASIEPGTPANDSPTRVRDQLELMPGLVDAKVHVSKSVVWDGFTKEQIAKLVISAAQKLAGAPVSPRAGKKIQAMVITDAANKQEEKAGVAMEGQTADYVKQAISNAGMKWNQGFYYTSLIKVPTKGKIITAAERAEWVKILQTEITIINPPIIIALGGDVARLLLPGIKGGIVELAKKVVYSKDVDANIVIGINPAMIWIDPSKQELLQEIFEIAADLML